MWDGIKVVVAILAVLMAMLLGAWVLQSKLEASAFNAVTGKHVTTWQAMWIQLRVQEQSK